jgi:carbamoyltransferase
MTVVIGFNWPVMHDHSVGVMGGGEFVFATEEERWTGHIHSPVLNTSFNLAGEPPVKTPLDAIKSLAPGGFKATYKDGYTEVVLNYV